MHSLSCHSGLTGDSSSGGDGYYSEESSGEQSSGSEQYSSGDKQDSSSGSSSGNKEYKKGVKKGCDPSKETQTTTVSIKWTERPDDCKGFFEKHNIGLEWLYDWEEEGWSTYAAEDVETANAIMADLAEVVKGNGGHSLTL
jgi:hypothetical protein